VHQAHPQSGPQHPCPTWPRSAVATKLPNRATTPPETHGTSQLTKMPTPRPRTACHYRRPEGQRKACGAAGARPGRRARSGGTRERPKRNVRQPTHCTRTACHHSRPEGQPGACGAAGALWDDKRTETLTEPQPQRTSRTPQEKRPHRPTWTAPKSAQCLPRRTRPPCKPRTHESDARAARASQR
jgi:hypothetical protein